jgi:hypothetical protein
VTKQGLSRVCAGLHGFARVLFEKPMREHFCLRALSLKEMLVTLIGLIKIKKRNGHLGTAGTDLGRFGTDVGTDKTCKIPNVYRPWDGGTDELGVEGVSSRLRSDASAGQARETPSSRNQQAWSADKQQHFGWVEPNRTEFRFESS